MTEVVVMMTAAELSKVYYEWLKEEINFSTIENNIIRIDTPFYNRHNDSIILYAILEDEKRIKLTDGGYTLDDLEVEGISITRSKKRRDILLSQLSSYGVSFEEGSNFLYVDSAIERFPNDKHRLLQAMLFTNDLFLTENKKTKSLFIEDVENYFMENDIRAVEGMSYVGTNGLTHKFEFSIPGSPKQNISDKLIKVLSSPNNEMYAKALTTDVRYTRNIVKGNTEFYTIINNQEAEISSPILSLMQEQGIKVIPFLKRGSFIDELGA